MRLCEVGGGWKQRRVGRNENDTLNEVSIVYTLFEIIMIIIIIIIINNNWP
jgi:hypothetical protein